LMSNSDGTVITNNEELFRAPLKPISHSGFPVVLMRTSALEKAGGAAAFTPLIQKDFQWGFAGEDVSFFVAAHKAGLKFAVDRRVKVPHMKLRAADPPGFSTDAQLAARRASEFLTRVTVDDAKKEENVTTDCR
jgi:hypothetical protein